MAIDIRPDSIRGMLKGILEKNKNKFMLVSVIADMIPCAEKQVLNSMNLGEIGRNLMGRKNTGLVLLKRANSLGIFTEAEAEKTFSTDKIIYRISPNDPSEGKMI